MNTLVIYPIRNQIKSDATGEFIPEALAFIAHRKSLGDTVAAFTFDPHRFSKDDTIKVYEAIEFDSFDCVAIFSHGIGTALPQLHIDRARCADFAAALTKRLQPTQALTIILYACLTAMPLRGANFAETLARELHAIGRPFKLFAHRTKGRADENPNVNLYQGATVTEYPKAFDAETRKRWLAKVLPDKSLYPFIYPFELPGIKP